MVSTRYQSKLEHSQVTTDSSDSKSDIIASSVMAKKKSKKEAKESTDQESSEDNSIDTDMLDQKEKNSKEQLEKPMENESTTGPPASADNETNCEEKECVHSESTVRNYLAGFGKRVVICTILVIIFQTLWPRLQPYLLPEDATKEGKMYVLTDRSFRGHVSRGDHFLMMYAPWCGHCQQLKPAWEKLAKTPGTKKVKIGKVDCSANTDLCKTLQVHGYPTLMYYRNGENLGKYEGDKSYDALKRHIKQMSSTLPDNKAKKAKSKSEL